MPQHLFRQFRLFVLALIAVCTPAWGGQLFFAVNEGSSSAQDTLFRNQKYQRLIDKIGQVTGKKVVFETSNVLSVLDRNIARQRYDLAFVRPSTMTARAIRDHGYRLVAMGKGEIKVHFIVPPDSQLKDMRDLQGRFILLPDKQSAPTQVALAVMRDAGIDSTNVRVQMLSQQEAVLYSLENRLADVGVLANPKTVQSWQQKGGRVLYVKDKLPFWAVIASPAVSDATVQAVRKMLIELEQSPEGQEILKDIEVKGFVPGDPQAYLDMLKWLEGK